MLHRTTQQFCDTFGDAMCDEIFAHEIGDIVSDNVVIEEKHRVNACNVNFSGYFEHEGKTVYFDASNGDFDGSVINSFSEEPLNVERYVTEFYFDLKDRERTPQQEENAKAILNAWRAKDDPIGLLKKEREMNYDRHFAPGVVSETHYREWGDKRGLQVRQRYVKV